MHSVELTANGRYLHCVCFSSRQTPRATVVIAGALGVKQRFYQPIAKWLSEQGYRVITFDYYGIGQSLDKPLKSVSTDVIDWAEQDINQVLCYAQQQQRGEPLIWLAHSLGGQIVALAEQAPAIDKMVTIASGTGYWREASKRVRRTSWLLWYFAIPLTTPFAGYFPGKRLNMIADMPAQAMHQWSRWCRSPNYLFDHLSKDQQRSYQQFTAPINAFHISDDELLNRHNINQLLAHYPNAPKQLTELYPSMTDSKRIGHFNFFRSQFKATLWQCYLLDALAM
ncbi:MAG: alpha/beta fold hydrolase [Pseudomonadota bacterium]